MTKDIVPALFEGHKIRVSKTDNTPVYCLADILGAAADTERPEKYLYDIRKKLEKQGVQLSEIIGKYHFTGANGKSYLMWGGTRKQIFRLLQELNTPRVAAFKMWLSSLAEERLQEIEHPSKGIDNAIEAYKKQGRTDKWIQERVKGKAKFASMTDALKNHGAENYALLIDAQHRHAFAISVKAHKAIKGIEEKGSLRDGMNEWELFVQEAADTASKWLLDEEKAQGQAQCRHSMEGGGDVAAVLRESMEKKLGRKVIDAIDHRKDMALLN